MNVHEYQAKELLRQYGVPLAQGAPALSVDDAVKAAQALPGPIWVVKSQIHAGGRGKGTFTDGFKGGVKFCKTKADAKDLAAKGELIISKQRGDEELVVCYEVGSGKPVWTHSDPVRWDPGGGGALGGTGGLKVGADFLRKLLPQAKVLISDPRPLRLNHVADDPRSYYKTARRIADIRVREPQAAFRSNFIVGYPGETEEDHDELLRFVTEAEVDWCGFFAYSPEEGTYAYELPGAVPTKLAAELLIEEYRTSLGVPAVIDRCGVIAGPWQMGKVDQGVFTHWMLAHEYRKPLSYIGYGGTGKQVRDLLQDRFDPLFC